MVRLFKDPVNKTQLELKQLPVVQTLDQNADR